MLSEIDYGTPERHSPVSVTLEINGVAVTVPEGTSVMRAATLIDRPIPKLCATDSLEPAVPKNCQPIAPLDAVLLGHAR